MPTLEERVAYIEGQMSEQSHGLVEVRDAIRHLEQRMDVRFVSIDTRFASIDRRFEGIDRRFESIEHRFDTMDRRLEGLDDKVSRQFVWLVGMQVTTLVAVVGALIARG